MGTCTGVLSSCAIGGFAFETRCHNGQVILYDTVRQLGWSANIRNHPIKVVIDRILADNADWKEEYNREPTDSRDGDGLLSLLRWGWGRRHGGGSEDEGDPSQSRREVPLARRAVDVEGVDGVCTVCR